MMDFGISTGISREKEGEPLSVYLHLALLGSVSFSPDIARMLAVQLTLNADLVDGEQAFPTQDDERTNDED